MGQQANPGLPGKWLSKWCMCVAVVQQYHTQLQWVKSQDQVPPWTAVH